MASPGTKHQSRRAFLLLGLILIATGVLIRLQDPTPMRLLRLSYFDYLQRLSPREYTELPVRIIDIDEAALEAYGQWPWPRTFVAEMTRRLGELGAAAIAFDVMFAEPDRYSPSRLAGIPVIASALKSPDALDSFDNDVHLAETIAAWPVVLGLAVGAPREDAAPVGARSGLVEIGGTPSQGLFFLPHTTGLAPPLGEAAAGIGGVNVAPDLSSGIVREVPLLWRSPDGFLPGLALEALRLALGESTYFLTAAPGSTTTVGSVGLGTFDIPTGPNGEIWVHYRHENPEIYISARDVLSGADPETLRQRIEGNILLVGTSSAGLLDIRTTALGQTVPGVSIHAQIIEQILLQESLERTDFIAGIEILLYIVLGGTMTLLMARGEAVTTVFAGFVMGVLLLGTGWFAFRNSGILFDASFPLVGGAANFFLLLAYQLISVDRDKRMIRRSFSHYVAPDVLNDIEAGGHQLQLGGITKDATVLFSDIRNFTPLSETMPATELVQLLNELFTELGTEILSERGTLDKFIGDAVMAFWNAPLDVEDHPLHAARAALRMRDRLAAFNMRAEDAGRPEIAIAIGFSSGPVCIGNIGSKDRFNYTAIGEAVNEAARIEASCRRIGFDIVTSRRTLESYGDRLALLDAGRLSLKGISEREPLVIVVGDETLRASEAFATLEALHQGLLDRLQSGGLAEAEGSLARCQECARAIAPRLATFYAAIPERIEDFA